MPLTRRQCFSVVECANAFNINHFFECKVCEQLFCTTVAFLLHKNDTCRELCGNSDKGTSKDGRKDTEFTQETLSQVIKELKLDKIFPVKKKAKTDVKTTDTVLEPTLQESSNENKKSSKTRKQRNKKLKQSQSMKQDKIMDVEFDPIPSTSNAYRTSNKIITLTESQQKSKTNEPKIALSLPEVCTKKTLNECFKPKTENILPLVPKLSNDSDENELLTDLFNKKIITWTEEELNEECQSILKYMTSEGEEGYFDKTLEGSQFAEDIKNAFVIEYNVNSNPKTDNENITINPENRVKGKTCKKNLNKGTKKGDKKNKK